MKTIPLIKLQNKKIIPEHEKLLSNIEEDQTIYVHDLDGITRNKPDLCVYQKISKKYDLWIDSAPRNLGDIVDIFLTGAASVIIRKKYYPQINIGKIREISENKIYTTITTIDEDTLYTNSDGLILINSEEQTNLDIQKTDIIKKYANQKEVFVYEPEIDNINYWLSLSIAGIITDIENYEEAKNWIQKKRS